jgi:CheY-like chemotaxis protein
VSLGHVLLVDDDEEIRATLGAVLQAEGFTVLEARNGLHALQQLMRTPLPDVILLDMTMPVMTGFEFLDLKGEDPRIQHIPVIAITVHAKGSELKGVKQLVRKPFDLQELLQVLGEVLADRPAP